MKVLFIGDASNMHNTLATALRAKGHQAVVISDGSRWMNTPRDIDLSRGSGMGGAIKYGIDLLRLLPQMRGYDVVELAGQIFLPLKPDKLRWIFKYLKRHNGKIVLSALNTDYVYYSACMDGKTYRYSDFLIGSEPSPYACSEEYKEKQADNWGKPFMRRHSDFILSHIDGAAACLYEYYLAYRPLLGERLIHAGLPIDTDALTFRPVTEVPQKVRFFIGIQRDRAVVKGADRLLAALQRVCQRYPDRAEAVVAESVPYADYCRMMRNSHVILDQLYSYTPGTNALIAMAQGLVAVSGAEPEYYNFIGEHDNRPIVNVSPLTEGDIEEKLIQIIGRKDELPEWAQRSRAFVERHNSAAIVAQRYLEFWNSL